MIYVYIFLSSTDNMSSVSEKVPSLPLLFLFWLRLLGTRVPTSNKMLAVLHSIHLFLLTRSL